jgi:uncharacterized protein (DUF1697 family)
MAHFIALLRGINVGGRGMIPMAELRAMIEGLGFGNVRTLLQSGNVVFEGTGKPAALERTLEDATEGRFGHRVDYLLRTPAEWRAAMDANPFLAQAKSDPAHLVVMFLKTKPEPAAMKKLQDAIKGREQVRAGARHLYITYPDGIGTSKSSGAVIERALATRGTARNWNTVLKLAALAGE